VFCDDLLFLGYIALASSEPTSVLVLVPALSLYCARGVASTLYIRNSVKRGRFPGKGAGKPIAISFSVSLGFGALSTGVIRLVGRKAKTALAYDTQMLIGTGIFWIAGIVLSLGCHMYLCFYYMRKYKVR
jgi:hypothetical protein